MKDLKSLEFEHKPSGPFGIGISLKLEPSAPHPIRYYREKKLETEVICDACTLRYAIYGVFGWCPDCGVHNSLQILIKNLELANKELALAEAVDKELADHWSATRSKTSSPLSTVSAVKCADKNPPTSTSRTSPARGAAYRRLSGSISPMA